MRAKVHTSTVFTYRPVASNLVYFQSESPETELTSISARASAMARIDQSQSHQKTQNNVIIINFRHGMA